MSPDGIPVFTSRRASALEPYTPGEQPQDRSYIKLNTNENPYPPAPAVQEYLSSVDAERLRLYPDPESNELRRAIGRTFSLDPDSVFAGNGSDEVLSFIFYAFFDGSRGPVLFPDHTYSFYPVYCSYYGIPYRTVPLGTGYLIDPEDYVRLVKSGGPEGSGCSGIVFPNPNAPTGAALSLSEIEGMLGEIPENVPVVIDEAYVDFGAETVIPLIGRFPNLIVAQTFSKNRSLAGMRVGYAAASPGTIAVLNTVKNSFNSYPLDRISQEVAVEALSDPVYFEETRTRIMRTRERTVRRLEETGFRVIPSKANFIFVSHPELGGEEIYRKLKDRGILVRYFGKPGIEDFVRISIGTDEEMNALHAALEGLIREKGGTG